MPNVKVSLFDGRPILDIASYARCGPGRRDRLSSGELAQIARTARRVPEVVIKVLPRGSNDLSAIGRHLGYIGRKGTLELESDDGERLSGKGIGRQLLADWDLDLDEHRPKSDLAAGLGRKPPKLVHKLMLSMPPGTPPHGLLAAAKDFLREEFALKHRYAFVLHTDEPHPHVHAVVKAVSEQGVRLNIRKAKLREWRAKFAAHLRNHGIEANATERAVRGATRTHKLDGIYRAHERGASTHMRTRAERVAANLLRGELPTEPGKSRLLHTRRDVERGWQAIGNVLEREGQTDMAAHIARFLREMSPPRTETEMTAEELLKRVPARAQDPPPRT